MPIPLTPGTPIAFDQINDELSVTPNQTTLDLETAGIAFGLDLDPVNWSDSDAGLGMDEFRGGGAVATAADITYVNPSTYVWQDLPVGTPNPTTNFGQFLQPTAVGNPNPSPAVTPSPGWITAGPHSITFGVTADGNYVISNAVSSPTSPISPTNGVDGSPPTDNLHTFTLPALPYSWESPSTVSPSPYSPQHNSSTVYSGFFLVQNRFPTPTAPATVLETATVRRMYNDKYLDSTVVQIPYASGTHTLGYIDWRFSLTDWSLTNTAPANPLPNTAPWVTGYGKGAGGTQPSTSNFYRQPVTVTVSANPSPTTTRSTQIFAFLPTAFNPTPVGIQMNRNGSPSNPVAYYYPLTIVQGVNPASAPTMAISPDPIPLDFSGTPTPVTLNVTPNTKSYSVSIVGPEAPNFSFSPTPSPKTGDASITVGATSYTGATPRSATLRTIIPAPNPADIVTTDATIVQSGISLSVGGFGAQFPANIVSDPVPYLGQPFVARPIATTAPSNAPWTATSSPFITIPATSGTGPLPTFGYEVDANPTYSPRPGTVTVDFDVSGNPYITEFAIDQGATPATPEITVSTFGGSDTYPFNGVNPLTTRQITIDTNVPFSVALTGDTPYWSRNATPTVPATANSFTVPFGAPSPYVFEYTTPAVNDDYAYRNATFTITSPVSPGTYTRYLQMGRNPSYAYLNWQVAGPAGFSGTGAFISYNPSPAPEGGLMVNAGQGGAASLDVTAHPNVGWTIVVDHPHPAHPAAFKSTPIPPAFGTGPGTWSIPAPSNPAANNPIGHTWNFNLNYSAPDVFGTADNLYVFQPINPSSPTPPPPPPPPPPTPTPPPPPPPPPPQTLGITPTNITGVPNAGAPYTITATGNAPFSKVNNDPTMLTLSPTFGQTAPTTFTVTVGPSPTPRAGSVDISSPAGSFTVNVSQDGTPTPPPPPPPPPPSPGSTEFRRSMVNPSGTVCNYSGLWASAWHDGASALPDVGDTCYSVEGTKLLGSGEYAITNADGSVATDTITVGASGIVTSKTGC